MLLDPPSQREKPNRSTLNSCAGGGGGGGGGGACDPQDPPGSAPDGGIYAFMRLIDKAAVEFPQVRT